MDTEKIYLKELCKFCGSKTFFFLDYQENGLVFCCKECADDFKDGKLFKEG
jgi:hypothetical protein